MLVVAVQFAPIFKSKQNNLRQLIRLGLQTKSGLIVFPELCTTGYSFMSDAEAREQAEVVGPGNTTFDAMANLVSQTKAYVVWGQIELDCGTNKLYNSQVCIAPDGDWVSYRKINLWANDFLWANEGTGNPPIIETPFGKLGLLICRDVRDKKNTHWDSFYERGDADVVALSTNWGRGGFPAVAWMDFSKNNRCALVVANRHGVESNNDFGCGGSCIISKNNLVSCNGLVWNENCAVTGTI